jgi:ABC-type transport system involved in cytochrome c biogenesis permease subunit
MLGILSMLAFFFLNGKKLRIVNILLYGFLIISFLLLSLHIGLRTYIAERLPFSNGFETMLIIAWCAMLSGLLFKRKIAIILPFSFLLSGCTLLVAYLGMMNPKITPLIPVLSSPLLSIHVSVIMLAYTLLAFIALNSLISIIQTLVVKKGKNDLQLLLERNKIHSLISLYPALLLLGSGIFIGAVWANISWGRYWGWDPKEVWALITFLVYGLMAHEKLCKYFSHVFFFHSFGLLAFSTVLMTYFGVNYFLGGMHSYAGEMELDTAWLIIVGIFTAIFALIFAGYLRFTRNN